MRSLLVGVMMLSACSFAMKSVDPQWDGTSQPDCSYSVGPVAGDAIVSGLSLGLAAAASDDVQNGGGNDALVIGGLVVGLVFAVSAAVGEHTYKECDRAMETWRLGGAIAGRNGNDGGEQAEREAREYERQHKAELAAERKQDARLERPGSDTMPAAAPAPAPEPRGFFCTISPAHPDAGFCARQKPDCQRSRDAALVALPDMTECILLEKAWCTGERCAPNAAVCNARREHIGSDAAACAERE